MRKLVFLIGLFCCALFGSAQIPKGYYLPFEIQYSNQIVKDASLAPVSYSGSAGSLSTGFVHQGKRFFEQLEIRATSGLLFSDISKEQASTALLLGARTNYKIGYKVWSKNSYVFYVGLAALNSFDYREINQYSNNSFNFQAAFGVGPFLTTQKSFALFRQSFNVNYQLSIPVVAYVLRPGYVKPSIANQLGYMALEGWKNYVQLDSKVSLQWLISTENYLCLNYQWEYFQLDRPNKIQLAQHSVGVSLLTHL